MSTTYFPPTPFDHFADQILAKLPKLSLGKCEQHLLNSFDSRTRCTNEAVIGDVESEVEFCRDCYKRFRKGEL